MDGSLLGGGNNAVMHVTEKVVLERATPGDDSVCGGPEETEELILGLAWLDK